MIPEMLQSTRPPGPSSLVFSRSAREHFGLEALGGDLLALRTLTEEVRGERGGNERPFVGVSAGRLLGLRLVGRFLRKLIGDYRRQQGPKFLEMAFEWLAERHGQDRLASLLDRFQELFETSGDGSGTPSRETTPGGSKERLLEDLLVLWVLNDNPAAKPWRPLFDDTPLEKDTGYREILEDLRGFFAHRPGFGPDAGNFFDLLRAPARAAPHSLSDQLRFLERLGESAIEGLGDDLLLGIDVLREEERPIFPGPGGGPPGPGPAEVLGFEGEEGADERFSPDRHWMPELVLLAKNAFVWLDQLSRRYGRPIQRLDEIPGRELDRMVGDGITGLWLIGIWQRSRASQRIKRLCGNPQAAASAYSLYDYRIASELGGEEALDGLRRRAWRRSLRLACDMVPNHMGIDSRWVVERPELFVSVSVCPYPNYRFDGPDLSSDPRVGIFLEDHYYDRSDAAVVFKRLDRSTGEASFIYHGNDGTGMPWNDTAQLDYLNPQTRRSVRETILGVAGQFPVIRFDAAMTLARRHIRRLWYPPPGGGGDIPSRSAFALPSAEFDRRLPTEFWRDVVDHLAEEAPDTLLLAEAFWLMEGYFVRTLGMHRVYNSAFMNMLRDEENRKFRESLKNTLEFRPEILRRFVNYVTTPDEDSALRQFGKGDKYFGICTLLATLPGLPLLGHGQFEGLAEKYGMEYRQAYEEEIPDVDLVARHERQIAPLLAERYLFAGVESFELYDFEVPTGVDDNVLAYSNGTPFQKVLVIFNNAPAKARGHLRLAVAKRDAEAVEGEASTPPSLLARALGLRCEKDDFCRFRDRLSGLEYLVASRSILEQGLAFRLGPYECRVLCAFEEMGETTDLRLEFLARSLAGEGVPSLQEALEDLFFSGEQLRPRELLPTALLRPLIEDLKAPARSSGPAPEDLEALEERWCEILRELRSSFQNRGIGAPSRQTAAKAMTTGTERHVFEEPAFKEPAFKEPAFREPAFRELAASARRSVERVLDLWGGRPSQELRDLLEEIRWQAPGASRKEPKEDLATGGTVEALLAWALLRTVAGVAEGAEGAGGAPCAQRSLALFDTLRLGHRLEIALRELGTRDCDPAPAAAAVRLFVASEDRYGAPTTASASDLFAAWIQDPELRRFLGIHSFGGVEWFHREAFHTFLWWWVAMAALDPGSGADPPQGGVLESCRARVKELLEAEAVSGYRVEGLLKALSK